MTENETNDTFHFELVSPEASLMAEPAYQVVIPGEEGHFGVLANHSALVSAIQPGVIEIWSAKDAAPKRIFIAGGFSDVTADNCTVLAEEAVDVADLDQAAVQQEVQDLTEDLRLAENDAQKARVEARLSITKAKLAAVSGALAA